jgi:assimilatory nitrate reductase catalytic subunit
MVPLPVPGRIFVTVRSTCPYCGVGCGVRAQVTGPRSVEIRGDAEHPVNRGKLCSKGTHLGDTVGMEGRLTHPMIGGRRASWDKALDLVARRFAETIERYGPDSVAFYISGQLLTEDYYVANKLMKGFIGSSNIDTNSRLCMSSAVAGHIRAFGEDVVPATYDDLDAADLIVLVGSNTAWCHPIVYQRIQAARAARGSRLVVVDPRRTETCEGADLHLAIRPGSDVALMNGLLAYCRREGLVDEEFLATSVTVPEGFWEAIDEGHDLWSTARACDVPPADLQRFFELFAATPRTVTMFSQGINQSLRGTDQVNAIVNLHLATGRIGKPGAQPFSITGQPNAMGGREVGGLASTLAAHMDFAPENVARVQRFWAAPAVAPKPGLKAVDMFRAVGEGRIKAIWIMATNPAVSMPDAGRVREALDSCPFVVVSDCIAKTDTSAYADVLLPAAGWGEKDGTVTNSDRTISRQRAIFPLPEEVKPDWWIISEVGRRMGWRDAFAYDCPAEIYREHARLSAYQNDGSRKFDLAAHAAIGNPAYDAMEPGRWGGDQPFADGRYSTPDGRARLVPVKQAVQADPLSQYPFTLNTGRYRDQWHTMTRTGLSARLSRHRQEPFVEIHPDDAQQMGVKGRDLIRVRTAQGESIFPALISEGQRRGELFTPIHWTDQQSTGGRTGMLPRPLVDPHSGQPGFKATPAAIEHVKTEWTGFLVSRDQPADAGVTYSSRIRAAGGWLTMLAGKGPLEEVAKRLLPAGARAEAIDPVRGVLRVVVMKEKRLVAALFLSRMGALPNSDWLIEQLEAAEANGIELLAGRPSAPAPDRGEIVCVCFDVGVKTIMAAIGSQRLASVDEVGVALRAGTNCGSCRPAIARLINEADTLAAAE